VSTPARGTALREPLLLAAQTVRDGELRVELQPYRAQTYLSARKWYRGDNGAWLPGKGLSVHVTMVPLLRDALQRAEREALASGLLDEESYQSAGLTLPAELGGA
jgi:hypothetical protein